MSVTPGPVLENHKQHTNDTTFSAIACIDIPFNYVGKCIQIAFYNSPIQSRL